MVRGVHSINVGYEYNNRTTYGRHGSGNSRGAFAFNGQYTGDGFADYLLGLIAEFPTQLPHSDFRHGELSLFGTVRSGFLEGLTQSDGEPGSSVGLLARQGCGAWECRQLGLSTGKSYCWRRQEWQGRLCRRNPSRRSWLRRPRTTGYPASQVGAPPGLFKGNGYFSPRLGVAWRPRGNTDLVVRAGYGIFTSTFSGNRTASSIVGPPYWTFESTSWSAASLQRWETAWPNDPQAFVTPSVVAPRVDMITNKSHQLNVSIQKSLPGDSAITVSYVMNRVADLFDTPQYNVPRPGLYTNLQAARPYPVFGDVTIYGNGSGFLLQFGSVEVGEALQSRCFLWTVLCFLQAHRRRNRANTLRPGRI